MNDTRPAALAAALRRLADLVESLDLASLNDLLSGRRSLILGAREQSANARQAGRSPVPATSTKPAFGDDLGHIVSPQEATAAHAALTAMSSREEAAAIPRHLHSPVDGTCRRAARPAPCAGTTSRSH
ncbi:Hypothetical protein FRAAL5512 [Frankia alni ACN14a]|uniref:Uncharacterized protein n=1 Tax=Frankia alni (strain DSM 45986 / CECT 9034 / ACN14a) TaxID=326424 RepID=Q0REG5_FRAAA|nr:Hypothetical protein FRAAL5512 [Frankia alni ACN14a]